MKYDDDGDAYVSVHVVILMLTNVLSTDGSCEQ